jgi:hypothetical protein
MFDFYYISISTYFYMIYKVRWNEKRLDPAVLGLLGADLQEYNARAIRNLIERHLLVHATEVGKCLLKESVRTEMKGWIWGSTINLLDDIKVEKVDNDHSFTVTIGETVCISGTMTIPDTTASSKSTAKSKKKSTTNGEL